jgi:hypothetical protein
MTRQSLAPTWPALSGQSAEAVIGRTTAACVHPFVAWRVLSMSWRLLVLLEYAGVTYLLVLAALIVL